MNRTQGEALPRGVCDMGSRGYVERAQPTQRWYIFLSEDSAQKLPKVKKGRGRAPKALQPGGVRGHPAGPGTSPSETAFVTRRARRGQMGSLWRFQSSPLSVLLFVFSHIVNPVYV